MKKIAIVLVFFLVCGKIGTEAIPEIDVVLSSNNSFFITVINNLQINLDAKINMHFLASLEEEKVQSFFEELDRNSSHFVITLGYQATRKSTEFIKNKKILYSLVHAPVLMDLDLTENACGVNTDVPIVEFFETLQEIGTSHKKVIGFYHSSYAEHLVKDGLYQVSSYNLSYKPVYVESGEDMKKFLLKNTQTIDAIYIAPDSIYNSETFEFLVKFAKDHRILLMTTIPYLVNLGATFSISPFYSRVGIQLGEISGKMLKGEFNCENNKLISSQEFSFHLNPDHAVLNQYSIPENLKKRSENNSIILEGISQLETGNVEVAYHIMKEVIKNDPGNRTALFFKNLANSKMNGELIEKYLLEAKKENDSKNYARERQIYLNILRIDPASEQARTGVEKSLLSESEDRRKQGNLKEKRGDIFQAIKLYKEASTIYPKNSTAKKELDSIRAKERRNLTNYKELAFKYYNNRNYKEAEKRFSEVLLIEPEDKFSKEYFVLSQNKRRGMEKYADCINQNNRNCYLLWKEK